MCGESTFSWIKDIVGIGSAVTSTALAAKTALSSSSQPTAARAQAPAAPTLESDSVQQAAEKERRRLQMAKGGKSTNVTKGRYEDDALLVSPILGGR